jgi:hypothetical protein
MYVALPVLAHTIPNMINAHFLSWDDIFRKAIARPTSSSLAPYIPAPTTLRQTLSIPPQSETQTHLNSVPPLPEELLKISLTQVLGSIEGLTVHEVAVVTSSSEEGESEKPAWKFDIQARENTWSRAARRKRKRSNSPPSGRVGKMPRTDSTSMDTPTPRREEKSTVPDVAATAVLHCRISILHSASEQADSEGSSPLYVTLEAQWVRGKDRALFEGFWSHLCRKVKAEVERTLAAGG